MLRTDFKGEIVDNNSIIFTTISSKYVAEKFQKANKKYHLYNVSIIITALYNLLYRILNTDNIVLIWIWILMILQFAIASFLFMNKKIAL